MTLFVDFLLTPLSDVTSKKNKPNEASYPVRVDMLSGPLDPLLPYLAHPSSAHRDHGG